MHRVHDPKCILAFFIVVGGGLCLAIRLDQRGPGPHCEAGHACSHASSAQEPCGGGFHLKSGFATFRSSGEIIFSFASLIPNTLKDGKVIFSRISNQLFPVGVTESGVQELCQILWRRREQHHSHPLHVRHRDVRSLHRHCIASENYCCKL